MPRHMGAASFVLNCDYYYSYWTLITKNIIAYSAAFL